jgi:transposase
MLPLDMDVDPRDQRIAELETQLAAANARVQDLEQQLKQALDRLEELDRVAHRQAAPFRRDPNRKIPPEKHKKPGRKPGHQGFFRSVPPQVDEEVDVPLDRCPRCGGAVSGVQVVEQYIEEIPPVRPRVTRLLTRQGVCNCCGEVNSTHPLQMSLAGGCAKVQLGPRASALATLLNKGFGLSMRRTVAVLQDFWGLKLTPGALSQLVDRVSAKVSGEYERLIEQVRSSAAVNADETSWWVGGPGHWLWTFTTPKTTVYLVDKRRGGDVVKEVLGENFAGVLVSDCLSSYDRIVCRKHKCFAHHLRAIESMQKLNGTESPYPVQWKHLFKQATLIWRIRDQVSIEQWAATREALEREKDQLLDQAVSLAGDVRIRNRLIKHREHLLRCLWDPAAEPTNNRAERALRPAVIARKISCGNKTEAGKQTWQTLTSLITTCRQRGQDFLSFLSVRLPLAADSG